MKELLQEINVFNRASNHYNNEDYSQDQIYELQRKKDFQESIITKLPTLGEYLTWQLSLIDLSPKELEIAEQIIGNINDDGQLVASIDELVQATGSDANIIQQVLSKIQSLDPPGIGGRTLGEIL